MFMFQAWLERNQEKFGSRQVTEHWGTDNFDVFFLRSSSDMWCSLKPRLRSVSSGKEVLSCAEPQESVFRFNPIYQPSNHRDVIPL